MGRPYDKSHVAHSNKAYCLKTKQFTESSKIKRQTHGLIRMDGTQRIVLVLVNISNTVYCLFRSVSMRFTATWSALTWPFFHVAHPSSERVVSVLDFTDGGTDQIHRNITWLEPYKTHV